MNAGHHSDSLEADSVERVRTDARARVAQLVADAERLLELARRQSHEIVEEANERAEVESRELRREAEQLRDQARREADELRRQAAQDREEARLILADAPHQVARSADGRTADEILRTAQAEADARARDLIEDALRRVENAETEGRRRLEEMRNDYRTMQQRIRQEEFAAKARMMELQDEVEVLEARRDRAAGMPSEVAEDATVEDHAEPVDQASPRSTLPGTPFGPFSHPGSHDRSSDQRGHNGIEEEPAAQTLSRFTATVTDPDRALRGIRRRA